LKVIYLAKDGIYINENDRIIKKDFSYEKGVVTASLGYKYILNLTFKLPKTIQKEMLEPEAEKYVFTEGSLDYTKEYKINSFFKEYDEYYYVEAFVVEIEALKKEFEKYLKKYKYIDFISIKPFVFKSYYEITKTSPKNDVFIFFDEEEAFLSCFEKGEFVFVKSVTKLSALANDLDLSVEEVKKLLSEKGLDENKYAVKETYAIVENFFSQFFMKVNNLINYSVNYYNLSKIDRLFFYSSFEINNLFENYESFWNLSGIEFKKYEVPTDYDSFDYTAVIYNSRHYQNDEENFSVFEKPLPFYKTKTGILILLLSLGVLFIGGDAFLKYRKIKAQENEILILKEKIARNDRERKTIEIAIKKYKKEIALLNEQNDAIDKQIADIGEKIDFLAGIQRKKLVSNQLADLVNELKKYNLKLVSYEKEGIHTDLVISCAFANSSSVADFMKDLYKLGYKNVTSTEIQNDSGIYLSKVSYDE
jgi:hypothetical protein